MHAHALMRPASEQHALSHKLLGRTGVGPDAVIFDRSGGARFVEAFRTSGYRFARAARPDQACCVWHDADYFAGPITDSQRERYVKQVHGSVRLGGWALIATPPDAGAGLEQALGRTFRRRESHRQRRATNHERPQPMDFHVFERVV